jgi:hypothetical protein
MDFVVVIQAAAGHFFLVKHGLDIENQKPQTPLPHALQTLNTHTPQTLNMHAPTTRDGGNKNTP